MYLCCKHFVKSSDFLFYKKIRQIKECSKNFVVGGKFLEIKALIFFILQKFREIGEMYLCCKHFVKSSDFLFYKKIRQIKECSKNFVGGKFREIKALICFILQKFRETIAQEIYFLPFNFLPFDILQFPS